MRMDKAGGASSLTLLIVTLLAIGAKAQCPQFSNYMITGNTGTLCEGATITISQDAQNIPAGSFVDWYIGDGTSFNPYDGDGTLIGSVPINSNPCNNPPQVLYIMVNPDNTQVGSSGDQCDEFLVLWTGSGGYTMNDFLVTNLGPGNLQWDDFAPGNASTFSCGVPLPPGPIPENAILIIQSSTANNVMINSDALCASGLPVYIMSYTGTVDCMFGYFDNNAPCSSCPINIAIDGTLCDFMIAANYTPPANSIDGWAWANTGAGVYADVIPNLNIPSFVPPVVDVPDFNWIIPSDFCENFGEGDWHLNGILNPPPPAGCPEIMSPYYAVDISCPALILSGGGEVCEGNCPDMPTPISFEVIGDDVPFSADIIVTSTGFPSFPINDLPVTDGQSIQVCLQGFFPSFDPGTGILNVPVLAIGLTATVQVVSVTSDAGCPVDVDPDMLTLTFIEAPDANAGQDQTICAGESVSLSGSIGGSASDAQWSTSGDGDFDDPTDNNATYTPGPGDISDGTVTLTLSGTDPNGTCIPATSDMVITIEPSVSIEVNTPLTICNTGEANVTATFTGIMVPSTWTTTGDGSFQDPALPSTTYFPGPGDISSGSVTLTFVPDDPDLCIGTIQPLEVTIVSAPQVSAPLDIEVCEGDSAVIQISIQGDYANVTWMTAGDGDLVIMSPTEITYTPGPADINNQFVLVSVTVQSIYPECGQTTYNISLSITPCNCPPLQINPPASALCEINDAIDLTTLEVNVDPGQWTITAVPPGSNPATILGDQFITNNSDPGVYEVTYTLSNPQPGCPASASENILVSDAVTALVGPDISVCHYDPVVLMGNFIPFSMLPIEWQSSGDGSFLDNTDLNTVYTAGPMDSMGLGVFLSLHVYDAICGDRYDTLTVFYNSSPTLTFSSDTVNICNATAYGSVLNLVSLIASGGSGGTWTNLSGVPVSLGNPAAVDFNGIAEGYYTFSYQTNSAPFPCPESIDTLTIRVEICDCPLIMTQNLPGGICNSLPQLALNAFVMAGAPGSWQIIAAPPGANPATVSGDDFIIGGADPGNYRLRFTFDAAPLPGCTDSAEIDIFLQDAPTIDLVPDITVCSNQQTQIFSAIGGSAIDVAWSSSGTGTLTINPGLSTVYIPSPADAVAGQVQIIGTTIDTFGFCLAERDTLLMHIAVKPFATFSTDSIAVCNNPDSNAVVHLDDFVSGGDLNGLWTDAAGSGATWIDPNTVDFAGVGPGQYLFLYSTNSAVPPCSEELYEFHIRVKDCLCPQLNIDNALIALCEGSSFDLDGLIISADPGSWDIAAAPAGAVRPTITAGTLHTLNASAGNYTLSYSLTDSVPGCPATVFIPLLVENIPVITVTDNQCDDTKMYYTVMIQTDGAAVTADVGDVNALGAGKFAVDSIPIDQQAMIVVSSAAGLCTNTLLVSGPDCACSLFTEDIADTITFCPGDTVVLIPIITGAHGLPFSTWVTPTGTFMRPSLHLSMPGQYIWIVVDSLLCEERDTFNAVFTGPQSATASSVPPSCPGSTDGQIVIESIVQGSPPYSVQVDGGASQLINALPFTIQQVGLGAHTLTISDAIGCELLLPVIISSTTFGEIDLGPDRSISKGDSTQIVPEIRQIAVSTFTWDPPGITPDLLPFWIKPDVDTWIRLTVTDTNGCVYVDSLFITVLEAGIFYIPNVITPNNDQVNDVLEVYTNLPLDRLLSLQIYDRWGSLLYEQKGTPPLRWDGTSGDQPVNPGVFVYKLLYLDASGNPVVRFGDVTIIR